MTIYRVQRMTETSYNRYMCGSNEYGPIEELDIEANSPEEAIKKAEKKGFVVNSGYIKTLEELEEIEREREERRKKYEEEEKVKKAKRLAKEIAKAEAMGMTLEEYKKDKAHKAHIRRLEREIEELENELIEKRKALLKAKK